MKSQDTDNDNPENSARTLESYRNDLKFFATNVEEEDIEEALTYWKEKDPKIQEIIDNFLAKI